MSECPSSGWKLSSRPWPASERSIDVSRFLPPWLPVDLSARSRP
ncbi:hypothetical protein L915_02492 [Phytophthora nicotianae]|uniref:Uncharacterized protein n=1 Tax=Phytophthora nicotianae TaxID=4792 RepID=W2HH68_PHYNI|nr:hypothetical protein L915_02492 [Phytophthora nicotianae]